MDLMALLGQWLKLRPVHHLEACHDRRTLQHVTG